MIVALFDKNGVGNPSFRYIFNTIFKRLADKYEIRHEQPNWDGGNCFGCPGGGSNFQVYNESTKKTVLLSFWDRGRDVFGSGLGWESYNIVQYIGGIGLDPNNVPGYINYLPFQYPLATDNAYEYCARYYGSPNKKQKAIFIGALYGQRLEIADKLAGFDLIDIYDNTHFHGEAYFNKMSTYSIAINFNGNGEFCVRDVEAMGLGLVNVRPLLTTQFYNKLHPGLHYIPCWESTWDAGQSLIGNVNSIADAYKRGVELALASENVANHGKNYFESFCKLDYMVDLYLEKARIDDIL